MAGTTVRGTAHEGQPQGQQHKLQRPVAIPQVHYKGGMPFTRAYSDALADCGITKEVLIQFIDQLNTATAGIQPLQHLIISGEVTGYTPVPPSAWVGKTVQSGAQIAEAAVCLTREHIFLKTANRDIFNPKGLKVTTTSSKKLMRRLGLADKEVTIGAASLSNEEDASQHQATYEGWMPLLRDRTSPLTIGHLPWPTCTENSIYRINAAAAQSKAQYRAEPDSGEPREQFCDAMEKHKRKLDAKRRKFQQKLVENEAGRQREEQKRDERLYKVLMSKGDNSSASIQRKANRIHRRFANNASYIDQAIDELKREYEDDLSYMERELQEKDDKGNVTGKIRWILIENCV